MYRRELISEVGRLFPYSDFRALIGQSIASSEDFLRVGLFGCEQVVDDASQLVSGCGYCFRTIKPPFHGALEFAQIVLGPVKAMSTEPQCDGCSVLHLARSGIQHLLPRTCFSGHSPSQDANSDALQSGIHQDRFQVESCMYAVSPLMPGTPEVDVKLESKTQELQRGAGAPEQMPPRTKEWV